MTTSSDDVQFQPDPERWMQVIGAAAAAPEFESDLETLITRTIATLPPGAGIYDAMLSKLSRYLEDWDSAYLLLSMLAFEGTIEAWDPPLLEHLEDDETKRRVEAVTRRLGSIYGRELWNLTEDWDRVDIAPSYDLTTGWQIDVKLSKSPVESLELKSPPGSILNLANHLLRVLVGVGEYTAVLPPGEDTPVVFFDNESADDYLDLSRRLGEVISVVREPTEN